MKQSHQRHILIVCALGQELQIVKSVLKGQIFQGIKFHYYVCGVGLEKSMISLTQFLSCSEYTFELVVNVGLAGYSTVQSLQFTVKSGKRIERGMIVQCLRVIQGDAKKELCVPPQYVIPDIDIVPLTSRYRVVRDRSQLECFLHYEDFVVVDMEGYSIEAVCDEFGYSRMFLKVLYDDIGKDDIQDYDDMLEIMKTALGRLPESLRKIL